MRILSVGNFTTGWDGSICDEEHIAAALERMGNEVERWQREEVAEAYSRFFKPEFILIAQWDGYPNNWSISDDGKNWRNGGFVEWLKHTFKCPVVYWSFDFQDWGQEWHERLVREVDLYLSKRIADSRYPNWQWLSQDFAPQFLDKFPTPLEKDIDILFTGSYLPWATERTEILKAVDKEFNLTIHSVTPDAWKAEGLTNVYGPVMDNALPELIARARVNLSIDHTIEAGYWSDRNAQIMACGGLVMFRYVPLSKTVFKDHIVYFNGVDDCIYRLKQLLERPLEDLDSVAEGGYQYAHQYMMVEDRVKDLLTIVENTVL